MAKRRVGRTATAAVSIVVLVIGTASCRKSADRLTQDYLHAGDRFAASAQYKEAILEYRNAVRLAPTFGEARYKLAEAYAQSADRADIRNAEREYIRAADLLPGNVEAQLKAGHVRLLTGSFEEAKTRAVAVLAKDSQNVEAHILLGNALVGLKDFEGALTQIERAIEDNPQRTLSYENLGAVEFARGNRGKAEAAFIQAVQIAPTSAPAHAALANYYWATGALGAAEQELKAAVALEPRSRVINEGLGAFYLSINRAPAAEPYLKGFAEGSHDPLTLLVLADYYSTSNRPDEARPIMQEAASLEGGFTPATLRLAALDFAANRRADGHAALESVLARDPKSPQALVLKARFLAAEGRLDEALATAQAARALDAGVPATHYLLGKLFVGTNHVDDAIQEYRDVLRLVPGHVPAALALAQLYLRRGDIDAALDTARLVVRAHPQVGAAHLIVARGLLAQRKTREAEQELAILEPVAATTSEVQSAFGELYRLKGDASAARMAFTRALELNPVAIEPLVGLVALDTESRNLEAAAARVERRLSVTPDDSSVLMLAAAVYRSTDPGKAEATLRHVIEIDPAKLEAYTALAQIHIAQHRLDAALTEFDALAKQQPKAIGASTMAAMIAQIQDKRTEAEHRYETILARDPRAGVAANNLAWLYADGGRNLDVALSLAQTAKAQLPDVPEVNDTLGWIYYKKGLSALAVDTLRVSVGKEPTNATYSYHLGLAYAQMGKRDLARQALERALVSDRAFPEAADAKRVLGGLTG